MTPEHANDGLEKQESPFIAKDDNEDEWLEFINQSWAKDWSDPREDIYTLEDGEPT